MDDNVRNVINCRIQELKREAEDHTRAIKDLDRLRYNCEVKVMELEALLKAIKGIETHREITKNVPRKIMMDERDTKKANIFLEFIEKCGDEEVYGVANRKMSKIGYYIYKNKLWNSWNEFREDLHHWVNGTGYWEDIKPKMIPPKGGDSNNNNESDN